MELGMKFHRFPPPKPPNVAFEHTIPTTISKRKGKVDLLFYTPHGYEPGNHQKERKVYPVVCVFHGGGFTIGHPKDDARWAAAVVDQLGAVVVAVDYRLAPENPFPTAVEDGADAVLYLIDHAEELAIDPNKICISGFSAGGNLAFSVPLRLQEEFRRREGSYDEGEIAIKGDDVKVEDSRGKIKRGRIALIMAWYPSADYTKTRDERKATNLRKDKELPKFFTDLFDSSYLHPPGDVQLNNPYLSPGLAPDQMLRALPEDIIIYAVEWDELRAETEKFKDRLEKIPGKRVTYRVIEGVMHGWDKDPNPLRRDQATEKVYLDACAQMKRALESQEQEVWSEQ